MAAFNISPKQLAVSLNHPSASRHLGPSVRALLIKYPHFLRAGLRFLFAVTSPPPTPPPLQHTQEMGGCAVNRAHSGATLTNRPREGTHSSQEESADIHVATYDGGGVLKARRTMWCSAAPLGGERGGDGLQMRCGWMRGATSGLSSLHYLTVLEHPYNIRYVLLTSPGKST